MRRVFRIYSHQNCLQVPDVLKAAKQEQQPLEMLQEVFRSIDTDDDQKISYDEFCVFVTKMEWKLREKFIPGEAKYKQDFKRLAVPGQVEEDSYIELQPFLGLVSEAGLNEIIAEAAFR